MPRNRHYPYLSRFEVHRQPSEEGKNTTRLSPVPSIVLEVFRGLEDFACDDLLRRLPNGRLRADDIDTALHSSFLVLSNHASRTALETALPFVSGRHILVGRCRFPDALLERLANDRKLLATCRRRNINCRRRKQHKASHDVKEESSVEPCSTHEDAEPETHTDGGGTNGSFPTNSVERLENGAHASEEQLKALMQDFWVTNLMNFRAALKQWAKHMEDTGKLPTQVTQGKWSYRVSVDRSTYRLPSLTTTDLEGVLADCVWGTLNGSARRFNRPEMISHVVSLRSPDLGIRLVFVPWLGAIHGTAPSRGDLPTATNNLAQAWENNPPGSMMLMVKLDRFDDDDREGGSDVKTLSNDCVDAEEGEAYREATLSQNGSKASGEVSASTYPHRPSVDFDLVDSGTALARFRAYTLASLLPLDLANQDGTNKLQIWEPCVGSGSIAIELAYALSERLGSSLPITKATIFGSDIKADEVKRARIISRMSGWPVGVEQDGITIHFKQLELSELRSVGQDGSESDEVGDWFSACTLDGIVTDLPWGRRVLGHGALSSLYLRFVQACTWSLRPGRYALALTLEHKTLQRALREAEILARKRGQQWCMAVEQLSVEPASSAVEKQGVRQAQELQSIRIVGMKLRSYIFLLKKVPVSP